MRTHTHTFLFIYKILKHFCENVFYKYDATRILLCVYYCDKFFYVYIFLQKGFITKIGGNSPRDYIHRILQKIFTNECALHCSWKGIRNNFKLYNLNLVKIIRSMYIEKLTYILKYFI